jgi:D-methionine transport system substrate-binding protein
MDRRAALRTLLTLAAGSLLPSSGRARECRIRVGVLPGPDARVMNVVRDVAASHGLSIEVVVMRDPARLNAAVDAGTLDANSCQHVAALEADVAAHGLALAPVAHTITLPLAIYSRKVRSLRALKEGDTIALPDGRVDAARALLLLHNYGLLHVADGAGLEARTSDVIENPRSLRLVSLAPCRLARSLAAVTAVALTYPLATAAGLEPARDSIAMEDARSPYGHVLVTRARDQSEPWVATLVGAYHSDEVKDFILTEFQDSVRRSW